MSYVPDTTTRTEFLAERNIRRQVIPAALHQFNIFCNNQYEKNGDILIQDIKSTGIFEESYTVLNQFSMWLSEDHLEISVQMGKSLRPITKRMSRIIYSYLVVLKSYFEKFGGIEINDRRFKKRVKNSKENHS